MDTYDGFWDRIARKYAAQPVDDVPSWEKTLDHIRRYLTVESHVLEIGGGTGSSALKLAGDAKDILSSDLSYEMVAIAEEKRAAANEERVRFLQGVAGDPQLRRDGGYDAVIALNLLHLLPDPPQSYRAIREMLKPGAVFLSKSACLKEMNIFVRMAIPLMKLVGKAPKYVQFFTGAELEQQLRDSGFEIVESCRYPTGGTTHFIVARRPN